MNILRTLRSRSAWIGPWLLAFAAQGVHAHGNAESAPAQFAQWPVSADAMIGLIVAAALYARGLRQMAGKSIAVHRGRHWAFYGGLASIFLALQTPLDVISEHVFAAHQFQHLLLRGVAPMLLMLAIPAGALVAGMPSVFRRSLLAPVMTNGAVRAIFRLLSRPLPCTMIYVGTLYVWQVPAYHDAALLDGRLHYLMHVTMLSSGMLFFRCVFDPHPAPWGVPFNQRLVMLGAAIFANIPLGAVTTLKTVVAYAAYDEVGRWWGLAPLNDELLGGLILWIPASMMGLIAVLLLVRLWGRAESKLGERRQRGFAVPPGEDQHAGKPTATTAAAAAAIRRRIGWGLAAIPLTVVAALGVLAVLLAGRSETPPDPGTFLMSTAMRSGGVQAAPANAGLPNISQGLARDASAAQGDGRSPISQPPQRKVIDGKH